MSLLHLAPADARFISVSVDMHFASLRSNIRRETQNVVRYREVSNIYSGIPSDWCLTVALIICCIMDHDFRVAVLWLKRPRRRGKPVPEHVTDEELLLSVEDAFLQAELGDLMTYIDPDSSSLPRTAIKEAVTFTSEFRLTELAWRRNTEQGAVLRPPELVEQYNTIAQQTTQRSSVVPELDATKNDTHSWGKRFRKKMGCAYGGVVCTDKGIAVEEMQVKA